MPHLTSMSIGESECQLCHILTEVCSHWVDQVGLLYIEYILKFTFLFVVLSLILSHHIFYKLFGKWEHSSLHVILYIS